MIDKQHIIYLAIYGKKNGIEKFKKISVEKEISDLILSNNFLKNEYKKVIIKTLNISLVYELDDKLYYIIRIGNYDFGNVISRLRLKYKDLLFICNIQCQDFGINIFNTLNSKGIEVNLTIEQICNILYEKRI